MTVNGSRSSESHPQMAGGTAAKKIKLTDSQLLVRPFIVRPLKFIFLQAAPAGGSWCSQQERLSRRAHRPRSLVKMLAPSGLFMARPLALVGDAS
ncbi:MAG: hypothetical protein MPJ79_03210, partial [Alphaproteobacteria bacterium]|nr:hypothetical protein [Alphaproteobacteria bacterium]